MQIEKIKEDLCIKKGWDGNRIVYPYKKDLDRPFSFKDNCNWKNLLIGGHWSRPFKMFLFLVFLYLFVQMYLSDTETCRDYAENFESYCADYYSFDTPNKTNQPFSEINYTIIFDLNVTSENDTQKTPP